MNLSFLEISTLYLIAAIQASEVVRLGCIYHDFSASALGAILVAYALARGANAFGIYWRTK